MSRRFPCPVCKHLTLEEKPPGTFDICAVCFWEDDGVQNADPDYRGGANPVSLREARKNFREIGAIAPEHLGDVRPPHENEKPDGMGAVEAFVTLEFELSSILTAVERAVPFARFLVIVTPPGIQAQDEDAFDRHLVREADVMEWPGTRKFGGAPHHLRQYDCNPRSVRLLKARLRSLFSDAEVRDDLLTAPDFALLREDDSHLLVVTTHERDAYLTLRSAELEA